MLGNGRHGRKGCKGGLGMGADGALDGPGMGTGGAEVLVGGLGLGTSGAKGWVLEVLGQGTRALLGLRVLQRPPCARIRC